MSVDLIANTQNFSLSLSLCRFKMEGRDVVVGHLLYMYSHSSRYLLAFAFYANGYHSCCTGIIGGVVFQKNLKDVSDSKTAEMCLRKLADDRGVLVKTFSKNTSACSRIVFPSGLGTPIPAPHIPLIPNPVPSISTTKSAYAPVLVSFSAPNVQYGSEGLPVA
jgi:hypothetical protein